MISGTIILAITVTMALLTLKRNHWEVNSGWHDILGVIILASIILLSLGGYFAGIMMNKIKWNTAQIIKLKMGHKVNIFSINSNRFLDFSL